MLELRNKAQVSNYLLYWWLNLYGHISVRTITLLKYIACGCKIKWPSSGKKLLQSEMAIPRIEAVNLLYWCTFFRSYNIYCQSSIFYNCCFFNLGTYLNATGHTLYFQEFDVKITLEGPKKFKPGLPYNAKVKFQ